MIITLISIIILIVGIVCLKLYIHHSPWTSWFYSKKYVDSLEYIISKDLHQETINLNREWKNNSPNYPKHVEDIKARGYRVLRNSKGKHRIEGGI